MPSFPPSARGAPSDPDFPGPPLHGFRGEDAPPAPLTRPRGLTIAVSREAGSRGAAIAQKVGQLLGWQVFDQELLDYLVQDDTARSQLLADVPPGAREWADGQLARLQRDRKLKVDEGSLEMVRLLLTVAARGDAILVGRGAGFLLPAETTLHVRVVAPLNERVRYTSQWLRMTREEALAEVRDRDERRNRFLADTILRDPADPTGYDLVVNSGRLGVEGAARVISEVLKVKQLRPDDDEKYPDVAGPYGDDGSLG